METLANTAQLVAKEQIPGLRFRSEDVLTDTQSRSKRLWDLNRATMLGNAYHGKVEITFQTSDGQDKKVSTTIWTVDDLFITLKAGCALPIAAILGIEFF